MKNSCAIILAGGDGTRMKSDRPKVMAEVLFKPMIDWVIGAIKSTGIKNICVVTGYKHEILEEHLGSDITTVFQSERLGTGHAVMQAREFLASQKNSDVLVLAGDAPLIDEETIRLSRDFHERSENAVTVISANIEKPKGYGRIIRDSHGRLTKIVEERDASDEEKAITEVNSGAYWFDAPALITALDKLEAFLKKHPNKAQEYYLTDAIEILVELGQKTAAFQAKSSNIVLGANTRSQLAELNEIARMVVLEKIMEGGVSVPFTSNVIISPEAKVGKDTVILPGSMILGNSEIGCDCTIGPNSVISNCKILDGATVRMSDCEDSTVGCNTAIGPFAHLRPDASIGDNVKVGNFVEVKNSNIGNDTKISHLSYIGDADLGKSINIGCGCATVNYSGKEKSRTVIEDDAFIGCDTNLVAPVSVGKKAYIAAGSTITEDVPDNALALARSRQVVKKDWVTKKNPYKK